MSHHEEHAEGGSGHAHPPPGIPDVKDEAGDSPKWLPAVGVVVVLAMVALIVYGLMPLKGASEEVPAADEKTEGEAAK